MRLFPIFLLACCAGLALPLDGNKSQAEPQKPAERIASDAVAERAAAVLRKHCLECHGGESIEGEFDLSSRDSLLKGGATGPAVVAGKSDKSLLLRLVNHTAEPGMPYERPKLTKEEIDTLRQWIDGDVQYESSLATKTPIASKAKPAVTDEQRRFWSFQPLAPTQPPQVENEAWPKTTIDRFILAKLEANKLDPSAEATRAKLVRRIYIDLIGLPPTTEELKSALADQRSDWYEQLVDSLLDSPHFGERWARHWLDLARFAESDGYEADTDRPTAWRYRDFVVRAFNDDMPFDRFVHCQLAGDEIENDSDETRLGTGFLTAAASLVSNDGVPREKEERKYNEWDDMLSTTCSTFLGLTVGCARCHDHKFDPIPTEDYYRLLAAFTATKRVPEPAIPKPGETPKFTAADRLGPPLYITDISAEPAVSYLLGRGDVERKVKEVPFGVLTVLTPAVLEATPSQPQLQARGDQPTTGQRLALANWMTDHESGAGHLLARVIVNRLWQHHFGEGIVRTPSDFGAQGDRPSHPELLDWLAHQLIAGGWRLKPIHRLIVTSSVYRQGIESNETAAAIDPDNRLLWRRRPRRIESETLRDSILAVSGSLNRELFGPSIKAVIPAEAMAGRNKDNLERPQADGPEQWRRSIYLFVKRSIQVPSQSTFDAPLPVASCSRRNTSTVAPQALYLLNDPFVRRQAAALAARCRESAPDNNAFVSEAYRAALAREPSGSELAEAIEFIRQGSPDQAHTDLCHLLFTLNEFMYVD